MIDYRKLKEICKLLRFDILTSTTAAGSGHPTSSLSAVELVATLFFSGFYRSDLKNPKNLGNDRFILSKGHASPLLYSLYHVAGVVKYEELLTLRQFSSRLQGHPSIDFPYVDVVTGSLGQGLSVGVGMALGMRLRATIDNRKLNVDVEDRRSKLEKNQPSTLNLQHPSSIIHHLPSVFVLLGDSEMAEGQVWEALEIAGFYKLNNLVGIIDVNRLGQQGQTEEGWNLKDYQKKIEAFGWNTILIEDGHDLKKIHEAFKRVNVSTLQRPTMIIARTIKGKGISFLENKEGWHGKALDREQLKLALKELGKVDVKVRGEIEEPKIENLELRIKNQEKNQLTNILGKLEAKMPDFFENRQRPPWGRGGQKNSESSLYSTREAFGDTLVELGEKYPNVVVLDAEVANSTFENKFQKKFPDRFFEMFIAEENMAGVALGLSKMGFIPFMSTFAAFLTQIHDQIRMAQYSGGFHLNIVGSHCGVSIGSDGPSQMGLEDIAMFRSVHDSVIFYPGDAVSTKKLTNIMAENDGIFYLRTTRAATPVIYDEAQEFKIGGSKIHNVKNVKNVRNVKTLIIAAGITLHEALKAQKVLAKNGIETVVLDVYCVKPLDVQSINRLTKEIKNVIVVEDHYPEGGIGEAVLSTLCKTVDDRKLKIGVEDRNQPLSSIVYSLPSVNFIHLCVRKLPRSGTPEELLKYEEIDAEAIVKTVKKLMTTI